MTPVTRAVLDFIADFGEAAVLLPAAAAAAVPLGVRRGWAAVLAWGGMLAACAAAALLLKTGIAAPDQGADALPAAAAMRPRPIISGHACIATAFYGGLAVLCRRAAGDLDLKAALALATAPAAAICIAVWALGWHALPEIACGILLGAVCPVALAAVPMRPSPPFGGAAAMLAAAALVIGTLHGIRIHYTDAVGTGLVAALAAF